MDPEFWHQRWRNRETGFHLPEVNPLLVRYWPALRTAPGARVFVPLCGKSVDMVWLLGKGYEVVGCELSPLALEQFFAGLGVTPRVSQQEAFSLWQADGLEIWCGDYFRLQPGQVGRVDAVYDRASLIALPPAMRAEYARRLEQLAPAAPRLLITLEYDQFLVEGPPFSVPEAEVGQLFSDRFRITELTREEGADMPPKFRQAGVTALTEAVYRLTPR